MQYSPHLSGKPEGHHPGTHLESSVAPVLPAMDSNLLLSADKWNFICFSFPCPVAKQSITCCTKQPTFTGPQHALETFPNQPPAPGSTDPTKVCPAGRFLVASYLQGAWVMVPRVSSASQFPLELLQGSGRGCCYIPKSGSPKGQPESRGDPDKAQSHT